jgi:hypothetical protein
MFGSAVAAWRMRHRCGTVEPMTPQAFSFYYGDRTPAAAEDA